MFILTSVMDNEGHSVEKRKKNVLGTNGPSGLDQITVVDCSGMKMGK